MKFTYTCIDCGRNFPGTGIMYRCPDCTGSGISLSGSQAESNGNIVTGDFQPGNLVVKLDPEILKALAGKQDLHPHDFFPYPIPAPEAYPVGNTPFVRSPVLSGTYGLKNLRFKIEGANPSGSFKDRASQLIAAQAIASGQSKIVLASTGNAGSAMACAGAAYGLDIILFVPASAPINKLMQSVLYGACVVPVNGTYDDAFGLSIEYSDAYGGINRNTAYNPMTVEGKKSVSIELFLQMGRNVPDIVYVPVGDGVILSGVYKGFSDLLEAGLIAKLPRLVCVQAEGSAAISQAFSSGHAAVLDSAETVADSISVASPAAGTLALKALEESAGWATIVSDSEILSAQLELAASGGMFAEPAASAAWAGARKDAQMIKEDFGEDAEVAVLLTGTGFKDMAVFNGSVTIPPAIEPNLESAAEFMRSR